MQWFKLNCNTKHQFDKMGIPRKVFQPSIFVCPITSCRKACKSMGGLNRHLDTVHPRFQPCLAGSSAQLRRQSPPQSPLPELECEPELKEADDQTDDHLWSPPPPVHDNDPDMLDDFNDMLELSTLYHGFPRKSPRSPQDSSPAKSHQKWPVLKPQGVLLPRTPQGVPPAKF